MDDNHFHRERRHVLEEDTIVELLAESAGKPYLKIDPLKLDASLITSTISLPFARRTSVLPHKRDADTLEGKNS